MKTIVMSEKVAHRPVADTVMAVAFPVLQLVVGVLVSASAFQIPLPRGLWLLLLLPGVGLIATGLSALIGECRPFFQHGVTRVRRSVY